MRLDTQTLFSDEQAATAGSYSDNVIDCQGAGIAEVQCYVVVRCSTAPSAALTVTLQGADEEEGDYASLGQAVIDDLTIGAGCAIPVPQGCPQYLRLYYTGGGATLTAGVTLQAPSPRGARIGNYEARV